MIYKIYNNLKQNISTLLLLALFTFFIINWLINNFGMLFDPNLQADDVCQFLIAFHYNFKKIFSINQIYENNGSHMFILYRILYFFILKFTNLYIAPKIVQIICFGIIIASGVFILKRKKYDLSYLLCFFFLIFHIDDIGSHVAGGLQRSFAFPAIFLWSIGSLIHSFKLRFAGILLSSLLYPPAMLLTCTFEFIYIMFNAVDIKKNFTKYKKEFIYLFLILLIALANISFGKHHFSGNKSILKFRSAQHLKNNSTFLKNGRTPYLPTKNINTAFFYFTKQFYNLHKSELFNSISIKFRLTIFYLYILSTFFLFFAMKKEVFIRTAVIILISTILIYSLSKYLAFGLYVPSRYARYGIISFNIFYLLSIINFLLNKFIKYKNYIAIVFMLILVNITGLNTKKNLGMYINYNDSTHLFEFISKLNGKVLISGHPNDLDEIPFWTKKLVTDNFETTNPFIRTQKEWSNKIARIKHTLKVLLYGTKNEIIEYLNKHNITHVLIKKDRYIGNYKKKNFLFEPINSYLNELYLNKNLKSSIFFNVPKSIIMFEDDNFILISSYDLKSYLTKGP